MVITHQKTNWLYENVADLLRITQQHNTVENYTYFDSHCIYEFAVKGSVKT